MSADKKIILTAWDDFQTKIFGPDTPEVQRTEMRRAFYAGAASTFYGIVNNVAGGNEEPTEDEFALADNIDAELKEWVELLKVGAV